MLQEASSIIKAIEKAWKDAGKPVEFTVKVLEREQKNFFGFTKRPAIVSIAFDPKKQFDKTRDKRQMVSQNKPQQIQKQQNTQAVRDQVNREQMGKKDGRVLQQPRAPQQHNQKEHIRPVQQNSMAPLNRTQPVEDIEVWTAEYIGQVGDYLKELLGYFAADAQFSSKAEKKALTIQFDKKILEQPDDERALFISLSYLLMQSLKKLHKKKFRGFQLILKVK